jgi:starvation-inducible DNA-binding protein
MSTQALDVKAIELELETGVSHKDRKDLARHLNMALASTYTLYAKTHTYHWNVAGPLFYSVHKMTEEQYQDMAAAIDAIAERVRAIGFAARGGLETFRQNSCIADVKDSVLSARDMVAELSADHQKLAQELRHAVAEADKLDDVFTADLLTARIGFHEEAAWMLGALLAN